MNLAAELRHERARVADALILEGLASEGERSLVSASIALRGAERTRERLLARRDTLAAIQPLLDDYFAFEAAARV